MFSLLGGEKPAPVAALARPPDVLVQVEAPSVQVAGGGGARRRRRGTGNDVRKKIFLGVEALCVVVRAEFSFMMFFLVFPVFAKKIILLFQVCIVSAIPNPKLGNTMPAGGKSARLGGRTRHGGGPSRRRGRGGGQ